MIFKDFIGVFLRLCNCLAIFNVDEILRFKGPLVKRLRLRPLTPATGVRFSHGSFLICLDHIGQNGYKL